MTGTKEKIFQVALELFAKNGYESSSVRDIAREIGITQAALYKHYKNKQDIFDTIIRRMKENEQDRAAEYNMPGVDDAPGSDSYHTLSVSQFKLYTMIQFIYWTEDDFASKCRKVLTLEQYRNYQAKELYQRYIVNGQFKYYANLIAELIHQGQWVDGDPDEMAMEYYGPIMALILVYDGVEDKTVVKEQLKAHIGRMIKKYRK